MESALQLKMLEREKLLTHWLAQECKLQLEQMTSLPGDASFRRYYRIQTPHGRFIAMDAAPPQENCAPFVAVAAALRAQHLQAPEIIQADISRGFLLLTDFGDATYLKTLNLNNAETLYHHALDALSVLQNCRTVSGHTMPVFDADFMFKEWEWHQEWFIQKLLKIELSAEKVQELTACYALLVAAAQNQPQVFMHRDYHSANLMVLAKSADLSSRQVGILDFQDAFIGPLTYDLVSLLRDCYIDWPDALVQQLALYYYQQLRQQQQLTTIDEKTFLRLFDWMGIQRHLKALLTFARKHVRDNQPRYLTYIPRVMNYLIAVSASYPELAPLHKHLVHTIQPALTHLHGRKSGS